MAMSEKTIWQNPKLLLFGDTWLFWLVSDAVKKSNSPAMYVKWNKPVHLTSEASWRLHEYSCGGLLSPIGLGKCEGNLKAFDKDEPLFGTESNWVGEVSHARGDLELTPGDLASTVLQWSTTVSLTLTGICETYGSNLVFFVNCVHQHRNYNDHTIMIQGICCALKSYILYQIYFKQTIILTFILFRAPPTSPR